MGAFSDTVMSNEPPAGTVCAACGERPATQRWGSALDMTHGTFTWRCDVCVLQAQVEHARERSAALLELERRLAQAEVEAGVRPQGGIVRASQIDAHPESIEAWAGCNAADSTDRKLVEYYPAGAGWPGASLAQVLLDEGLLAAVNELVLRDAGMRLGLVGRDGDEPGTGRACGLRLTRTDPSELEEYEPDALERSVAKLHAAGHDKLAHELDAARRAQATAWSARRSLTEDAAR